MGFYIFDVKVCEQDKLQLPSTPNDCSEFQEKDLYDEIVHKLYVKVE